MRPMRLLLLALTVILFAGSAWAFRELPPRIPVHFGLDGQPDSWKDTSVGWWFGPSVLIVATSLCASLVAGALVRGSGSSTLPLNFPGREKYLTLSPERRRAVDPALHDFFDLVGVTGVLIAALVQLMMWQGAINPGQATIPWAIFGTPVAALVVGIGASRVGDAITQAHRATE
jgi:uncharacterized membrane protein